MQIEHVKEASPELLVALGRLIGQLTPGRQQLSREELEALLRDPASALVIVREPDARGPIVGVACLVVYHVPTGLRAIIEDVVVDEAMRKLGIGEALLRQLLKLAREKGAKGVSLTSNPRRKAANRLYLRLGFSPRETNNYYYRIK